MKFYTFFSYGVILNITLILILGQIHIFINNTMYKTLSAALILLNLVLYIIAAKLTSIMIKTKYVTEASPLTKFVQDKLGHYSHIFMIAMFSSIVLSIYFGLSYFEVKQNIPISYMTPFIIITFYGIGDFVNDAWIYVKVKKKLKAE